MEEVQNDIESIRGGEHSGRIIPSGECGGCSIREQRHRKLRACGSQDETKKHNVGEEQMKESGVGEEQVREKGKEK